MLPIPSFALPAQAGVGEHAMVDSAPRLLRSVLVAAEARKNDPAIPAGVRGGVRVAGRCTLGAPLLQQGGWSMCGPCRMSCLQLHGG